MQIFDHDLEAMQAQVARKKKLEAILGNLAARKDQLSYEVQQLSVLMQKEQRDVDALERISLASIFSAIRGNQEERMDRERMEAQAAALKYQAAVNQRNNTEADIKGVQGELQGLSGCEARYQTAVQAKLEAIKQAGAAGSQEIYHLEERLSDLGNQVTEIDEALAVGEKVFGQIDTIESSLDSAHGWGTYDMLGGGMLSTMIKHSHLDDAQGAVEQLQYLLSRLRTELSDVRVSADIQIEIEGFLRFADYFFDGLFADWMVLDRINRSRSQVDDVRRQVSSVIDQVGRMKYDLMQEMDSLRQQLQNLATGGKG